MSTTPRRIEYSGPERWTVWTDEDGVHVRTPKGDCLESGDLRQLIALVTEAQAQRDAGFVPTPKVPSPEERLSLYGAEREEYAAKKASRAVYAALAPTADPAF